MAVAPKNSPITSHASAPRPTTINPAATLVSLPATPTTTTLELTAVVIVALVFFVVYRSPLLWFFPRLGAAAGIQVAQAGAHGLASAGLTVSPLSSSILIVLVFGAASDYALLLIHRYREELCRHAATEDAMAAALAAPCRPCSPPPARSPSP